MKVLALALILTACGTDSKETSTSPIATSVTVATVSVVTSDTKPAQEWYEEAQSEAESTGLCVSLQDATDTSEAYLLATDCEGITNVVSRWIMVESEMRWKLESTAKLQLVLVNGAEKECAKSYNQMVYSHLVDGIARYSGKPLQQVYTGYDSQCRELTSITVSY